jgi:hypothetical protein
LLLGGGKVAYSRLNLPFSASFSVPPLWKTTRNRPSYSARLVQATYQQSRFRHPTLHPLRPLALHSQTRRSHQRRRRKTAAFGKNSRCSNSWNRLPNFFLMRAGFRDGCLVSETRTAVIPDLIYHEELNGKFVHQGKPQWHGEKRR